MAHKKSGSEDVTQDLPSVTASEPDVRTVDAWAEEAGHPPGTPGYWKFSAAQPFLKGWRPGALVTKGDLESAMAEQLKQVTR